ncbi:MAG: helicase-associated domain-containing protein, partial [Ktedonobacterales bacterium]
RETLTVGDKLSSWSMHDLVMQARRLFKRWPSDRWWLDLPGADYREWHNFYLELPLAREAVVEQLRTCQPGVWYSLKSFRATIQGADPYVLRPSQRGAGEAGFKLAEELRAHWDLTDGEIITGMFRSTLYELGFVALGYDRDAPPTAHEKNINPDAFMLTDLGYEAMHGELSASQQPSPRSLIIQPNFQIFLMEPHMPALFWLARFANMEQIGRVSRFTFTREALRNGLRRQGSATIDEVIAFLERHSQKALPQNVVYTLRDWERQLREAHDEPAFVLKFKDEGVVDRVLRSNRLKVFRLRRVDSRSVVAPPEISLGDLRGALERLGYAKTLLGGLEELVAPASMRTESRRPTSGRRSAGAQAPALKNL